MPLALLNDGVSFSNVDASDEEDEIALTNDGQQRNSSNRGSNCRDKSNITCHRCGAKGHYAPECDGERKVGAALTNDGVPDTGATLLMHGIETGEFSDDDHFQFLQHEVGTILKVGEHSQVPNSWILLDNQSTVDVFQNAKLLSNIWKNATSMTIHCNAGVTTTSMVGDLSGYGTVWYHPSGIANILSLARVKEHGFHVTYDSTANNEFKLIKPTGGTRIFKQSERGLFYFDTLDVTSNDKSNLMFVNTVEANKSSYTNQDYSRAVLARTIQKIIGRPSTRTFMNIVSKNLLPNCPITTRDIQSSRTHIWKRRGLVKRKNSPPSPTAG